MAKHINQISSLLIATMVSGAVMMSCEDTQYPTPTPATSASSASAQITFVNVSPDAPALNFFVENTQAGSSQTISTAPTVASYVGVQAGSSSTAQLRAKAASGSIGGLIGSNDILYRSSTTSQGNFTALANTAYTAFLTDTLNRPRPSVAGGTNPGGPQFVIVTDTLTAPAANTAKLRVFNFAPDVSTASVRLLNANGASVATFQARAFRNASGSTLAYTTVPAGTYVAQVYAASSVPSSVTATPVASSTLTMESTKIYSVYAKGLRRTNTLSVGQLRHN